MGNQSTIIFGFLVVAFFVYITAKGELPTYMGLLLLSPPQGSTTGKTDTSAATSAIIQGAIAAAG